MVTRDERLSVGGGGGAVIPASVDQSDLNKALEPFLALLGLRPTDCYDSPGFTIGDGKVTFTLAARGLPESGAGPVVSVAQIGAVRVVGEGVAAETGLDVTVAVRRV